MQKQVKGLPDLPIPLGFIGISEPDPTFPALVFLGGAAMHEHYEQMYLNGPDYVVVSVLNRADLCGRIRPVGVGLNRIGGTATIQNGNRPELVTGSFALTSARTVYNTLDFRHAAETGFGTG
ncbi:hypothetical protein [Pelagimonas varians]|nr:hypothetical protein [Pelagimonas varians]